MKTTLLLFAALLFQSVCQAQDFCVSSFRHDAFGGGTYWAYCPQENAKTVSENMPLFAEIELSFFRSNSGDIQASRAAYETIQKTLRDMNYSPLISAGQYGVNVFLSNSYSLPAHTELVLVVSADNYEGQVAHVLTTSDGYKKTLFDSGLSLTNLNQEMIQKGFVLLKKFSASSRNVDYQAMLKDAIDIGQAYTNNATIRVYYK